MRGLAVNPANQGKQLEMMIDYANVQYRIRNEAVITKVPTPWKVSYDRKTGRVRYAFPDKDHPKQVDYTGHSRGVPVAFDAKSTKVKTRFDLKNIEAEQMRFLKDWLNDGGVSFLLIEFESYGEFYCVPFDWVYAYWEDAESGGRKSIPYKEFRPEWRAKQGRGVVLDYLTTVRAVML